MHMPDQATQWPITDTWQEQEKVTFVYASHKIECAL